MTKPAISTDVVSDVVCQVVRLTSPAAPARVRPDQALISDLRFHSLALAELGFTLEDLFSLDSITPEKAMRLHRVSDIVALIREALASGDAVPATIDDIRLLYIQRGLDWEPK